MRGLRRVYRPVLEFALANRIVTLGCAALVLGLALLAVRGLGLEFLPHLEEGNLWIRATMPPSISLEEGNGYVNRMRRVIRSFPEVVTVVSQHGRPDDGTDATGFFNAEFFVPLKPFDEWPAGVDKDGLTRRVNQALEAQFPGVEFNFSQYIEDNVEEAASGVKGENSVKLFGNDLAALEKTADQIKDVMSTVPGITDLAVFNSLGQPTVGSTSTGSRAARYGLSPGDINATIAGGDRRPGGRQPLRRRQRPQLSDDRPAGAAIPREPVGDPAHHDRRAEPERQRHRADSADRRRRRQARLRRLVHLSREPGALHPDQVQRARARSRRRGAGGPAKDRPRGPAARRAIGSNGSASSASSRMRSSAWRSSCR